MPKEKINRPRVRTTEAQFIGAGTVSSDPAIKAERIDTDSVVVQVGWHKTGEWVQVSIEADVTYFQFVAETPDAEPLTSDSARSTIYSPPLTREEINDLIRVLRRARDQAYGRDE